MFVVLDAKKETLHCKGLNCLILGYFIYEEFRCKSL